MTLVSKLPPPPPPAPKRTKSKQPSSGGGKTPNSTRPNMPRWAVWVLVAVAIGLIAAPRLWPTTTATKVTYTEFLDLVNQGKVDNVTINN